MSREWMALCLGVLVGGIFGSVLWLFGPNNEQSKEVTLYYHQIGIYANDSNANNALGQLEAIGLDGYKVDKNEQSIIVCGFVFSKEESEAVEATLKGAGLPLLEKQQEVSEASKAAFENDDASGLIQAIRE